VTKTLKYVSHEVTDVSRTITFPGQDVSRMYACPDSSIISPDNHFPGQTFPGQFV